MPQLGIERNGAHVEERLLALPWRALDETNTGRYTDSMKTLTITVARKNLGRWLQAAARGEDIGIVAGADIIALRKVDVESTDYANREYDASADQVEALERATDRRYRQLRRSGRLLSVSAAQLRKLVE
jgi:antitoxin (DNA-binding transcriptional repressor) of toxin-antitoxin stability system